MTVLDAHLHLWRLAPERYGWLDRPDVAPIRRDCRVEDAALAIGDTPVDRVILVQAENSAADTRDMLAAADRWPAVVGVVAWLPLEDPVALEHALSELAGDPRVVGCRHLNHDEPDPGWLSRPGVHDGLRLVAEHGLAFDVVAVTERHLRDAAELAAQQPDLTVVVDHLGSPPLAGLGWQPWADALAAAAGRPNTVVKVSGLSTLGPENYTTAGLGRYLDYARAVFGAERMMFGGDWPVSTLALPYPEMWRVVEEATAGWPEADRDSLFDATARRSYRLGG